MGGTCNGQASYSGEGVLNGPICGSRKCPYSLHRRDWKFLEGWGEGGGGGGPQRPKILKKCIELNWNFQRGGVSYKKNPFHGGKV